MPKIDIREYMNKHKINVYQLNKMLGNRNGSYTFISQKLKGDKTVKYDKVQEICDILTKKTGDPITPQDVITEVVVVKL